MVNASLSSVLRSGRDQFNALFAATRHQYPDLDGEAFKEFVLRAIEPLAVAVDVKNAARTASVVQAAFEIGLELAGQRLVGRGARHAFIEAGWQRILPRYPALLAERPFELLGAVSNALHQLATTPGARPEEWITDLAELSVLVPNIECFLQVGQVCAWRAGLAHYRRGALRAADALGETFHHATNDEELVASEPRISRDLTLKGSRLHLRGKLLGIVPRGELTSAVINGATVVITCALTHKIGVCSASGVEP